MKNITEFKKLFKVNIPIDEHSDYYIKTLMKSPFYAGLKIKVREFEEFERFVEEQGFSKVRSYKMKHLDELADYIKGTEAYAKLIDRDFSSHTFRTKDEIKLNDNTYMISVDFKAANYNALKTYDTNGDLYDSWEQLCEEMDIHPTLASSKSFRQIVFGNTNPKRLQRTQHANILIIVEKLIEGHGFEEDDFIFISHDEFVVRLRPDQVLAKNRIILLSSALENIITSEGISMPIHYKIYKNELIQKDMRVQTQYQMKMGGLSEKYDLLISTPGNKFYKYFKTHIVKEPLDHRDLMFMNDGEIATWAEEEDSISEQRVPEGELTLAEALKDYPYFFERLKKEVPGLNDAQRRKIINISLNMCNACHNADCDCSCWNDE